MRTRPRQEKSYLGINDLDFIAWARQITPPPQRFALVFQRLQPQQVMVGVPTPHKIVDHMIKAQRFLYRVRWNGGGNYTWEERAGVQESAVRSYWSAIDEGRPPPTAWVRQPFVSRSRHSPDLRRHSHWHPLHNLSEQQTLGNVQAPLPRRRRATARREDVLRPPLRNHRTRMSRKTKTKLTIKTWTWTSWTSPATRATLAPPAPASNLAAQACAPSFRGRTQPVDPLAHVVMQYDTVPS